MRMLEGRVVIVTGGGRGLGRTHCIELARHGAIVVVNDIGAGLHGNGDGDGADVSPATSVVVDIEAQGGVASTDATSVTDYDGVAALIARTVSQYGRLDAIVNNAGIVRDRIMTAMTEEDFDRVVAVHLKGTFNVSRHACAYWKACAKAGERVTGRIVNTTSGAGLFGNPGQANYGPAKAAIASLTTITAMEMERYGVTANAISPLARTRMTEGLASMNDGGENGWDRYDPANASPVVAWLCSEESGWLSGSVLRIDGDAVQRLRPWSVDNSCVYHGAPCQPVDATSLGRGLRTAFGALPSGLPASSVAGP
jgi:NAD(P)-dependent dehydrogenase (short-subunit alcohol dehydrogenase family)